MNILNIDISVAISVNIQSNFSRSTPHQGVGYLINELVTFFVRMEKAIFYRPQVAKINIMKSKGLNFFSKKRAAYILGDDCGEVFCTCPKHETLIHWGQM
jgi:hypothetical protein